MKNNNKGISWVEQYKYLTQNIKGIQREMDSMVSKLTSFHSELDVCKDESCINVYNSMETGLFVKNCDFMKNGQMCENEKCSMYSDSVRYFTTQKRLVAACKARREFIKESIKGIFR